MNQTSLNQTESSEKAVKHTGVSGVSALLASHSFFRNAPQVTVWEHLTAKTLKQTWIRQKSIPGPTSAFFLHQSLRDGPWKWLPELKSISHLSSYKPLEMPFDIGGPGAIL